MPANKEIFSRYPNSVFIESGSLYGDGIQAALDAGFKTVYSIELSPKLFLKCSNRFKGNPNVHMVFGDSGKVLGKVLMTIRESVTFWLDGHYSGGVTVQGDKETPLMEELFAISLHPIKTHTILIDDLRCWDKKEHGFNTEILKEWLLDINKDYKFRLETGKCQDDILAVYV